MLHRTTFNRIPVGGIFSCAGEEWTKLSPRKARASSFKLLNGKALEITFRATTPVTTNLSVSEWLLPKDRTPAQQQQIAKFRKLGAIGWAKSNLRQVERDNVTLLNGMQLKDFSKVFSLLNHLEKQLRAPKEGGNK